MNEEAIAYLRRVRDHFGMSGSERFTLSELVAMLDEYDKVEPAPPRVVRTVSDAIETAIRQAEAKLN